MAKTPKATLLSVEDAPAPSERAREKTPEEQRADFVRKVMDLRAEAAAAREPKAPPAPTERQRSQLEAEIARGKEVLARHAERAEAQRAVKVERSAAEIAAEGTSTPVFRPHDYVPNMDQGKVASASARTDSL